MADSSGYVFCRCGRYIGFRTDRYNRSICCGPECQAIATPTPKGIRNGFMKILHEAYPDVWSITRLSDRSSYTAQSLGDCIRAA